MVRREYFEKGLSGLSRAHRALKEYPQYATPSIINGIRRLIGGFDQASAGSGYYGREKGRIDGDQVALQDDPSFSPYSSPECMVDVVLDELLETAPERRQGFGGLWHIINHAAALIDLSEYGYPNLAQRGLEAYHRHVRGSSGGRPNEGAAGRGFTSLPYVGRKETDFHSFRAFLMTRTTGA